MSSYPVTVVWTRYNSVRCMFCFSVYNVFIVKIDDNDQLSGVFPPTAVQYWQWCQ